MLTLRALALVVCVACFSSIVRTEEEDRYELSKGLAEENPSGEVDQLQVGCEEGYSGEKISEEKARKARSYFYRVETPTSLISVWKPAFYRIQRPYYIPVYGAEGQIPFYFPPQPVFVNPGFPLDNPPVRRIIPPGAKPRPGYLPPKIDTTTEENIVDNRFGEDNPVWDTSPANRPPQTIQPPRVVPTRRPKTSRTTTVPPLIHNIAASSVPPPPNIQDIELGGRNDLSVESTQTTPRPSQCVWAIINCCSAGSSTVSNSCFERFACPGPFWDRSPCESDFARIAIQSALGYYENK